MGRDSTDAVEQSTGQDVEIGAAEERTDQLNASEGEEIESDSFGDTA